MSFKSNDDFLVKAGLAQMLKGGVIMDVIDVDQARVRILIIENFIRVLNSFRS